MNSELVTPVLLFHVKVLEIKTSKRFNLAFANNIILSYFFFVFFLIISLYFLSSAVIPRILNSIVKLTIPIGIPNKEAKAEVEIHPVTGKAKMK